jgi:hypothetical protein
MSEASHITRYDVMPIPPIEAHTEWFDAGPLRIGVEYRLLTDAIAAAAPELAAASGDVSSQDLHFDDCGVSLHVLGENGGTLREWLRFDCFVEDPHYHYVSWDEPANEVLHLDPIADGDPLGWALERVRTRLPRMLERAGAHDLAAQVDATALEAVLPRVAEAAYRVRYHHDDEVTLAGALDRNAS